MSPERQSHSPAGPGGAAGGGRESTIVVGAGIGGLACAVELAAAGRDVLVVEAAAAPGGKVREVEVAGQRLDAGPTVFTMRWVFEELFAAAGAELSSALDLEPCAVLARHAWADGATLDLHAEARRSADAIGALAGAAEAKRFLAFCARAAEIHDALEAPFLRSPRPTPVSLAARAGWRGLPALLRISPFATMWGKLGEHFHDPRLRQLFGRYATYCGSSPFAAPATLMLVAHVEQQGVWRVTGGMHRIAVALQALAERRGARFHFGARVREIAVERGRVAGVHVVDASGAGSFLAADAVVFNGDAAALAGGLLGAAARRAVDAVPVADRSLSAITWNAVATTRGFPLVRHNVFFGADYAAEFDAIFKLGRVPDDPTVYVCAQDRGDGSTVPPKRTERLLCLVNAPALADRAPLDPSEVLRCQERMTRMLRRSGLEIAFDATRTLTTTPQGFDAMFPGSGGAIYGRASHGWAASFSRPGARSRIPGLYLAGGTVHPGPGVPMAALSGRQAAASVMADRPGRRASMPTFPTAATPGGMSTR